MLLAASTVNKYLFTQGRSTQTQVSFISEFGLLLCDTSVLLSHDYFSFISIVILSNSGMSYIKLYCQCAAIAQNVSASRFES